MIFVEREKIEVSIEWKLSQVKDIILIPLAILWNILFQKEWIIITAFCIMIIQKRTTLNRLLHDSGLEIPLEVDVPWEKKVCPWYNLF